MALQPTVSLQPKGKSDKSQFMGHVSQSLPLSGANKPLSKWWLVSLLNKFRAGNSFLSGVEGFVAISLPFICMYVCVCMYTCLRMQLSVDELGFCVSVFSDAISVIEFRLFAAGSCPSVKGDFCPPNVALWLTSPAPMAICATKKTPAVIWQEQYSLHSSGWMVILLQLNGFQDFLRHINREWCQTNAQFSRRSNQLLHWDFIKNRFTPPICTMPNQIDNTLCQGDRGCTSSPLFVITAENLYAKYPHSSLLFWCQDN